MGRLRIGGQGDDEMSKFSGIIGDSGTEKLKNTKSATEEKRAPGRPRTGRRTRGYEQTSVWLPPDLMDDVKQKLIILNRAAKREKVEKKDFSQVVEELLSQWVKTERTNRPTK